MALINCPECGRKISDRAAICPDCAFPINEYVQELNAINTETTNQSEKRQQQNEKVVKTFKFLDYELQITEELEVYNLLRKDFAELAADTRRIVLNNYTSASNIRTVLETIPQSVSEAQGRAFEKCIEVLYKLNVQMSVNDFADKYYSIFSYDTVVEPIIEKYSEIINEKSMIQQYRALQQNNRSQWQGGGFGVGGAIKGALIAGALNTGTDFLRSFGDTSRKWKDDIYIQNKLSELYKSDATRNNFVNGAYHTIMKIFDSLYIELSMRGFFTKVYDEDRAKTIFENSQKYADTKQKLASEIIAAINENPYEGKYYLELYKTTILICNEMIPDEKERFKAIKALENEILSVLRYFSLSYYADALEQRDINDRADKIIRRFGLFSQIDLNNVTISNYKSLQYDYRELVLRLGCTLPTSNKYYVLLHDYTECASKLFYEKLDEDPDFFDMLDVFEYEDDYIFSIKKMTLKDYVVKIFRDVQFFSHKNILERNYTPETNDAYSVILNKAQDCAGIKTDKECILIHDSSNFQNMNRGYIITIDSIILVDAQKEIPLKYITNCTRDYDKVRITVKNIKEYRISLADRISAKYLESILKYFCKNMYNDKLVENDEYNGTPHSDSEIHNLLEKGKCLMDAGDFEEARNCFSEIKNESAIANLALATTFVYQGGHPEYIIKYIVSFFEKIKNSTNTDINKHKAQVKFYFEYKIRDPWEKKLEYDVVFFLVKERQYELLKKVLEFDINVNGLYKGATLLDYASYASKNKEICDLLKSNGAIRKWDLTYNKKYIGLFNYTNVGEFIRESCKVFFKSSSVLKVGDNLLKEEPQKAQLCIKNFNIPSSETLYMITDSTLFHDYKQGIAFCTTGAYILTQKKEKIFFPWDEFSKVRVNSYYDTGEVVFDDYSVFCSAIRDKLWNLINHLQKELSNIDEYKKEKIKESVPDTNPIQNVKQEDINILQTIYCVHCGNKIRKNVKFCNYCGKPNKYQKC